MAGRLLPRERLTPRTRNILHGAKKGQEQHGKIDNSRNDRDESENVVRDTA